MSLQHSHSSHFKTLFGFWLYLMSDCLLFASLFATYAVLHETQRGISPGIERLFGETLLLLLGSFAGAISSREVERQNIGKVTFWLGVILLCTFGFAGLQFGDFSSLIERGLSWTTSGFLSAYFTLLGTHTLHILVGGIWAFFLLITLLVQGISPQFHKRIFLFRLFFHFLYVIWILVLFFLYLGGPYVVS